MAYPTIDIEIKGYNWHVKCYEISEREGEELQKAGEANDNDATLAVIAGLIIDWDCTDRQGYPLPKTAEGLKDVPKSVLEAIINGIGSGRASLDPKAETSS